MANVPRVIVKLVAAALADTRGAVRPVSAVVLQVTDNSVPRLESGWTKIALEAVTAVVVTVHVPVEALVAQLNEPDGAAEQAATLGLAAVPAAAHLVVVNNVGVVIDVVNVGAVPNTSTPVPVSSLITPASWDEVVAANCDNGLPVTPHVAQAIVPVVVIVPPVIGLVVAMLVTVPAPPGAPPSVSVQTVPDTVQVTM